MSATQDGSAAHALGAHSKDATPPRADGSSAHPSQGDLRQLQPSGEAIDQILDEAREFVGRSPITAVLVAIGVGWLIGRVGP